MHLTRTANAAFLLLWVVTLVGGLPSCRKAEGGVVRSNPKFFSAGDELAIGDRLLEESWRDGSLVVLEDGSGTFTDEAYRYLRPLLLQLVDQQHITRRDSFRWDLHLVVDEVPHAYTLPGGQLMLHTGLLHALESEAEFVGLLAREIALAETGAAMDALDRQVEDNVVLGDLILGNPTILDELVRDLPNLAYTPEELYTADSLAAKLVCPSDYEERGLTQAVSRLPVQAPYLVARPAVPSWSATFDSRVSGCVGADSLYAVRYRGAVEQYVPR